MHHKFVPSLVVLTAALVSLPIQAQQRGREITWVNPDIAEVPGLKHRVLTSTSMGWYDGWLTGKSTFPEPDQTSIESVFVEIENAKYGSDWRVVEDTRASNGKYLTIKRGLNSPNAVPSGSEGTMQLPFTVTRNAKYYLFARVNCPSADDDSFWIKVDGEEFQAANGLRTTDWDWVQLTNMDLTAGEHTLTVGYREDGALIDKVCMTTYVYGPADLDEETVNISEK